MSIIKNDITLLPPEYLCTGNTVETFSGCAVCCPYCKGKKFLITENHREEPKQEKCPVCKGYGTIFPEVTVRWKAFSECNPDRKILFPLK